MITIDESNIIKKNREYKMVKVDLDFNKILEEWVNKGIVRSKTEATAKMFPIVSNIKFNINSSIKPTRVTYIKRDKSKRRKIELELGIK